MKCITTGFKIHNDENGVLKKLVNSITINKDGNITKRDVMVTYLNSQEFLDYVKEYVAKSEKESIKTAFEKFIETNNYLDIDVKYRKNVLSSLLNDYYRKNHPNVNNYIIEDVKDNKLEFSTSSARTLAIDHTANLVLQVFGDFVKKNDGKVDALKIVDEVSYLIKKSFNEVANTLIAQLEQEGNLSKQIKEAIDRIKNKQNELDITYDRYDELYDKYDNGELTDEEYDELDNLDEEIKNKKLAIYLLQSEFIENYGSSIDKNWRALIRQISGNRGQWFNEVFRSAKLFNFRKQFEDVLENDKIDNYNAEDDLDIENFDNTDKDEMSKSWVDSILSSYDKTVGARVKLYLSSLINLKSPGVKGSETYDFDTNNELGVKTTMDVNFLIASITNYASFYSIHEFKESIYEMSQSSPEYYGLIDLYNKMSKDHNFAIEVMKELANPRINKTMAIVQGAELLFRWSNVSSDHRSKTIFDMLNCLKAIYKSNYNKNDYEKLKDIRNYLTLNPFDSSQTSIEVRNELDLKLTNLLRNYFPILNTGDIAKYLSYGKNEEETKEIYNKLINTLNVVITASKDTIDIYNTAYSEYLNNKNENAKFDYASINFSKLNNAAIQMANLLFNFTKLNIELNSSNAEGNMSSDLIKNSYITNLLKQINYAKSKEEEFTGLQRLKEFISQGEQYKYSPIFWGVKDDNGKVIVDGLFTKNGINPDAKKLISVSLFDGTKNNDEATSAMYESMGKNDYLLTQLLAYHNPIKNQELLSDPNLKDEQLKSKYAGFFMRTPSDAPRNYIVQMIKYNTDNLFIGNGNVEQSYLQDIYKNLKSINKIDDNFLKDKNLPDLYDYIEADALGINSFNITKLKLDDFYNLLNGNLSNINFKNNKSIKYDNKVIIPVIYEEGDNVILTYIQGDEVKQNTIENLEILKSYITSQKSISPFSKLSNLFIEDAIIENKLNKTANKNNQLFLALKGNILNELNNFVTQLNNIFINENGRLISRKDTKGLIDIFHYNKTIVKNGKLTGNLFKFIKLFDVNGYSASDELMNMFSLYGGANPLFKAENDRLVVNTTRTDLLNIENSVISLNVNDDLNNKLDNIISNWLNNYLVDVLDIYKSQKSTFAEYGFNSENFIDYAFNYVTAYMTFDDLFEGDSKIYKDARDFLKRAKEVQAGGQVYAAFDFNDPISGNIHDINMGSDDTMTPYTIIDKIADKQFLVPRNEGNFIVDKPFTLRNGFRAITIHNTVKVHNVLAGKIKQELTNILSKSLDKKLAENIATQIASGYTKKTAVNDAQSYITLEEFISRKAADGTLDKYKDLIIQLLDPNVELKDINTEKLNDFIQVQKNFYFDKVYDAPTKTFYTRQIKNAEFVLIPKLIKGTELEQLYNFMRKNDIGQVNTKETSKAGRRNILTFWDNEGNINSKFEQEFSEEDVDVFYYKYLYKQQDVPQHMKDATNKAGIQIMKKILDNSNESVKKHKDAFFNAYVANIRESFMNFLDKMGWKVDETTKQIVSKDGNGQLLFTEFYKTARKEASRLGMDQNFIDYFTESTVTGFPIMPNYLSLSASKQESIAQALFNSSITRQTLFGWHGAQVTSVGHGALTTDGTFKKLQYHPEIVDENGNVVQESYAEVLIPRWSNLIPKGTTPEENEKILKQLQEEGLDIQIAYRIPTEGKQSISTFKVVGFLDDIYGSTIMVPDEWVIQTGSDFDVDSIYAIHHQMYKDKNGNIKRIKFDTDDSEIATKKRYINRINKLSKEIIDKVIIKEEDINGAIKDIKDELDDSLKNKSKELYSNINAAWEELIKDLEEKDREELNLRNLVKGENPKTKYIEIIEDVRDLIDRLPSGERRIKLMRFVSKLNGIINLIDDNNNIRQDLINDYKSKKEDIITKLFAQAFEEYFNKVEEIAKKHNLISFKEFSKLNIIDQNNKAERTALIVDSMIAIMNDENSREENYSRSNFDALTEEMDYCNFLRGVSLQSESTYNPFDQLNYMENARSGASLKAFSVTRDTFLSINNVVRTHLQKPITVVYDLTETVKDKEKGFIDLLDEEGNPILKYNEELIINTYESEESKKDAYDEKGKLKSEYNLKNIRKVGNKLYVKHQNFGWSNNNRNIVGQLITPYSSQTTAHILDAIKTGSIFNENKYTFGSFKTLVDLGIDYGTAITFLMQPSITEINNFNSGKESVYNSKFTQPIKDTLVKLLNELGVTNREGKPLTSYITIDNLDRIIRNNPLIKQAYLDIFGENLTTIDNIPLNGDLLKNRLNNKLLVQNGALSKEEYDKVFDIFNTLFFNNIYDITKNIEKLARCCNPDKFGAKQTIYETRQTLNNIKKFSKTRSEIGNTLLTEDNIPLLQAIYPNNVETDEDINNSAYPYLAAFLKYATIASVDVNTKLFTMEGEDMDVYLNIFTTKFGINLNTEQYKDFKKYLVSQMIAGCEFIENPKTIDSTGRIIDDIEMCEYYTKTNTNKYWNVELARLFGYDILELDNFEIKDIENPTEEELFKFRKLTPAQKVLKIRSLFTENAGLFEHLNINLFHQYEFKEKGYTSQSIKVNEQIIDKQSLYEAFNAVFYSKNPLIRLSALDLIKYAFAVEHFSFKKGSISKIITNKSLYGERTTYDTDLITEIENQKKNIINTNDINTKEKYVAKYLRSHKELVTLTKLNKENTSLLNSLNNDEGMIYIPITKEYESLLQSLIVDNELVRNYIKIKKYKSKIDTLYKIKEKVSITDEVTNREIIEGLYLIPLNYLEYNETNDISINPRNNRYQTEDYYNKVIDADNTNQPLNPEIKKNLKENTTIPKHKFNTILKNTNDVNYLINNMNTGNKILDSTVEKFVNDIIEGINNLPVEGFIKVDNPNPIFWKLFNNPNNSVFQNVIIDGEIVKVQITPIKTKTKNGKTRTYIIKKVEINNTQKEYAENKSESDEIRKSILDEFDSEFEDNDILKDDFENVALDIYNEIDKQTQKYDDIRAATAKATLKNLGLDEKSNISIKANIRNIYTIAAQYFTKKSEQLIYEMSNFKSITGETFDISKPELYAYLRKHPEDYVKLIKLLLDAKTLGESFGGIFNLHLEGVDEETKHAIKVIKKAIDDVRKNTRIKKGFELIFNDYIANEYANNPLIRENLIKLRTQFGDTDFSDLWIADIGHINNKEIQTVVKMVYSIINEANQIVAPKLVDEFTKNYNNILNSAGEYDENNIIDKYGRLILNYKQEFLDKQAEFNKELISAKQLGTSSLEYVKKKLEYDKWKLKNVNRELINDYYKRDIELREYILNNAQNLYLRYLELTEKLYSDSRNISLLSKDEKIERRRLNREINNLTSEFNNDGTEKNKEDKDKANALKEFIKKTRELKREYYDYAQTSEFNINLNKYINIKKRYENDHPNESLSERLMDSSYREAYEWIQDNTYLVLDDKSQKAINNAFEILRNPENKSSKQIEQILKQNNAYDDYGNVDPRKLSDELLKQIKDISENQFSKMLDEYGNETVLISNAEKTIPTDEAKEILKDIFGDAERVNNFERNKLITEINKILSKVISSDGKIHSKDVFEKLTKDEIEDLGLLYESLTAEDKFFAKENKENKLSEEDKALYDSIVTKKYNFESFNEEFKYFEENIKGTDNELLWVKIFGVYNKGRAVTKNKSKTDKTQVCLPNPYIFRSTVYKKNYRNTEKEKARNFISKHIRFVPTEFYYDAEKKAKQNGTYDEWYKLNHIYNPINHNYEPLRIWTSMEVNSSDEIDAKYSYSATFDNSERTVKQDKKNDKYDRYGDNYNTETGEYNNLTKLSSKELAMVKLLRETLQEHAFNNRSKQFIKQGFLPRRYKPEIDYKWYTTQILGAAGISFSNTGETEWNDNFDYTHDREINIPMMEILKTTSYKKLEPIPAIQEGQDEEEYNNIVDLIKSTNEERIKENLKSENAILDKNWLNVFQEFIAKSVEANAREKAKNTIYLLIEDLKENEAIKRNTYTGNVQRTKRGSTEEEQAYVTEKQTNALEITKNFGRRLINKEFKKNNNLNKWADLIQNMTSAKYMIFNVTGGIANVGTGFVNILGEAFANDFFNVKELNQGIAKYLSASPIFLTDMYKDKSTNKTVALSKFFDVVDLDAMNERRSNESTIEYANRFRNALYSLQSGGEHYMQNSVLFAMLKSHRIFKDFDGTIRIGSLSNYLWHIETQVIRELLNENKELLNSYNYFIRNIKNDMFKLEKYDTFKRNINEEFLRDRGDNELIRKYINARNEAIKKAKKDFYNDDLHQTLESQLELINGRVNIKEGSQVNIKMLSEFKTKVIYANKKIHGVYDKLGAAKLESLWWGGLVMQYHKHIYPGIMKRFRTKGYYNELTQNIEVGSYITLSRFLSTEFRNIGDRINNSEENKVLASIQEVYKALANTILNFNLNYQLMSEFERRNLRRVLGDLCGIIGSMLMGILLYGITDDDEIEDSEFLATCLYMTDRLLSESMMYTPWGAVSEASTLWSSPIAGWSGIKDSMKGLTLLSQYMFDDDFNVNYTTGLYKGENKFTVLLYKNTPVWRIYKRLSNMTRNNSYYRLNESALNIKLSKSIADMIAPD